MKITQSLIAFNLVGLSCAYSLAQAETVAINQNGSLVEMCASAEKMVSHDSAMMNVDYSAQERDKVQAADKVNRTMSQALQLIKKYNSVTVENQYYNTNQESDKNDKLKNRWNVQQSFSLTGKNLDEMSALAAQLQSMGVNVSNMQTFLTPEGRRLAEQELSDEAFSDVKARIATVAKAFDQPVSAWRIAHMDILPNNPCNTYRERQYDYPASGKGVILFGTVEVAKPEVVQGREQMRVNFYIAVRAK